MIGMQATVRLSEGRRDWRWLWLRHRGFTVRGYIESWRIESGGRASIDLDAEMVRRMRLPR